jgi:hypothetical protein
MGLVKDPLIRTDRRLAVNGLAGREGALLCLARVGWLSG